MWKVRGPQCYGAVLMAEMDNCVMFVLGHGDARSELRAMLCDKLPYRDVLILQITRISLSIALKPGARFDAQQVTHNGGKKPMKWKEFQACRFDVRF